MSLHGRGDLREPGTLGFEGLTHGGSRLVVTLSLGVSEGTLELSDLLFELSHHAGGACARFGVSTAPFLLFRFAHGGLDGTQASFDAVQVGGGHATDLFPAVLNVAQLSLGALDILHGQDRFGINQDRFLGGQVLPILSVRGFILGAAGVEEHLLSGAEAGPQGVVISSR